jgi:UDP:flavonoid glycosyltransferase YjiC (YdhE family)
MRRFLFTTLPTNDLGLLARTLPVANCLASRGHAVAFCNPAEAPSHLIAEAGFANLIPKHPLYHMLAAKPDARGMGALLARGRREYGSLLKFLSGLIPAIPTKVAASTSEIWDIGHLGALSGMLHEGFVRASCEGLVALIAEFEPDAVVDAWNPLACIAARASGTPLATIIQADLHPLSRGFIWWKDLPPDLPTPVPVLNGVLPHYGLQPIRKTENLSIGDLTLVLGMPGTDPLPAEADVTYVGPVLWQRPESELPAWFDELNTERPVIWVYSGNPRYFPVRTPVDSAVVLEATIAALAGDAEGGWNPQVVLTTGHHALPRGTGPLPANFRYEPYVPGMAMARRSDLLIHHGGYGSCQTGLATGTPAVIIPTYSERESNARRVAAAGAGTFVLPVEHARARKQIRAEELRAAVHRVLEDPAYTLAAKGLSQKLQAYGGAQQAARLIEDLANTGEKDPKPDV